MEAKISVLDVHKVAIAALLAAVVLAHDGRAEERAIPELGIVLVIERAGPPSSDAVHLEVSLRDAAGEVAVRFPSLVGPVHLSVANAQLFSCESNSTLASREARAFHLDGRQAFIFPHRGYLRDCGITFDQRVYWLIYNTAIGGLPTNRIVVLNSLGEVVAEAEFPESRSFRFSVAGKTYSLPVSQAEMPG